jgi:mannose-6-phosphate isomerase-like protein (cupin superfamily)
MLSKASLSELINSLTYLPNRTPEMAFNGEASEAFAEVSAYRDGSIYVGHYSGNSEWERHAAGDEIVIALEGKTTVVVFDAGAERRFSLAATDLLVVPKGSWHRFENSQRLKVLTVTPQPTEHRIEVPRA